MPPNPLLVFCIISVSLVGAGLAYGDVRDDVANLKSSIQKIEEIIEELDEEIISQKNIIAGLENTVQIARDSEKAWRKALGDSWQSQVDWEKSKKELRDAENELTAANEKLQNLLDQRNTNVKQIIDLEDEIENILDEPPPKQDVRSMFGISLDKTCITFLKNNMKTPCPTYEDILIIYPDNSNQEVSGAFGYDDGIYQRYPTTIHNSHKYYEFGENVLFIDPPVDTKVRIKNIEIRSSLDEYLLKGSVKSYDKDEHSVTLGTGRYVDKACRNAYVDADTWIEWVGDTIHYMNNGCDPAFTKMNSTITTQLYKTDHDITTSYKFKLEAWQKEMINRCGSKVCLYEKDQIAPP